MTQRFVPAETPREKRVKLLAEKVSQQEVGVQQPESPPGPKPVIATKLLSRLGQQRPEAPAEMPKPVIATKLLRQQAVAPPPLFSSALLDTQKYAEDPVIAAEQRRRLEAMSEEALAGAVGLPPQPSFIKEFVNVFDMREPEF